MVVMEKVHRVWSGSTAVSGLESQHLPSEWFGSRLLSFAGLAGALKATVGRKPTAKPKRRPCLLTAAVSDCTFTSTLDEP